MNGMIPIGGMPTRTSGIEKNAARVAMATSQQVTKPAPPPTAPPSTTATVGLGRPSRIASTSRSEYLAGSGGSLCARPARRQIGAGAEMLARAAENDHAHTVVHGLRLELLAELVEHGLVERIAALGPVKCDRRDAPGRDIDRYRLQRHSIP